MLGSLGDAAAVGRPDRRPRATPTSTCATPPRPASGQIGVAGGGAPARSTRCAPSPGSSTRPSTPSARSATRGPRRRSSSCSTTSCFRGPALEALGRLAGREALPRIDPAPLRSRARPAQRGHPRGGRDRAAGDRGRREPRPRGAGRAAAARTSSTTCSTTLVRRGAAQPPHGGHHPGLAQGAARRAAASSSSWATPRCRSTPPTPSSRSASGTARPTRQGLAHADDAVRQGTVRCLAWIAPPGRHRPRGPAHPRPLAGGAGRGGGRHRPAGRRGRGHAALRAARRRERADPGERHGRALAHARRSASCPLLLQALASAGRDGAGARGRRPSASCAIPSTAPALDRRSRRTRARPCGAPRCKALGEIEAPGVLDVLRAALARREQPGPPAGGARPSGKLQEPETAPDLLPLLDDPDPRMRFATLRALGQIRNPEAVPRLLPVPRRRRARSCASPRSRRSARSGRWPRCARWSTCCATPTATCAAPRPRAWARSATRRRSPPLLLALEDEHWSVRCAAATALGRIGSAKAVPALLARLDDEDATVRRAVVGGPRRDRRPARGGPPRPGPRRPRPAGRPPLEALRRLGAGGPARDGARASRAAGARGAPAARGPRRPARGPPRPGACCWPPWPTTARRGAGGGRAGPRRRRLPRGAPAAAWT